MGGLKATAVPDSWGLRGFVCPRKDRKDNEDAVESWISCGCCSNTKFLQIYVATLSTDKARSGPRSCTNNDGISEINVGRVAKIKAPGLLHAYLHMLGMSSTHYPPSVSLDSNAQKFSKIWQQKYLKGFFWEAKATKNYSSFWPQICVSNIHWPLLLRQIFPLYDDAQLWVLLCQATPVQTDILYETCCTQWPFCLEEERGLQF